MEWLSSVAAALVAAPLGWLAARNQHRLYSEPAYRSAPLGGAAGRFLPALVALGAAATSALAFRPDHYRFGPALATALFCAVLVVLASTDFERKRLPNRLTYPAAVAAVALCWAWPDRTVADVAIGGGVAFAIAAALIGLGELAGAAFGTSVTPFGMGDAKLIVVLGLILGWPAILGALFWGVVVAGLPALGLLLAGRRRTAYAYGPYLALAGVVALLFPALFV